MSARTVFLTCVLALVAGACHAGPDRPLTLAEVKTLTVTTPLLHLTIGAPTGYLYAWVSDDGKAWQEVFRSDGWSAKAGKAEGEARRHAYVLLEGYPRRVRVGTTGYYTGPVSIDAVEILLPDGSLRRPESAAAVNRASAPENALAADGQCTVASHTVGANATERAQVDAVELLFPPAPAGAKYRLDLPRAPLAPPTFGVYVNVGSDGDPHNVPLGYTYQTRAADLAFYDFSIPQSNNPPLFAEVKKRNPKHRILLRLFYGTGEVLDYCFDEAFRKGLVEKVVKQFSPNVDDFHGVVLSEEELQHALSGWYADKPPAWMEKYRDRFEQETGQKFEWHSSALREWLTEKCVFLYNDLYDQIKKAAPRLKVMPFLYVPGDISGWGWIDPARLKKDGWIYQWFDPPSERSTAVACTHKNPEVREVWGRDRWFNLAIQQLRAAGVPNDELYVQIWSYLPGQDPVAQTENIRRTGVRHIFNFYYAAWIPPAPAKTPNPRALCLKTDAAAADTPATTWVALGAGHAQRFTVAAAGLKSVVVAPPGADPVGLFAATVEADDGGRPSGKPLATTEFTPAAGQGSTTLPLAATLEPGKPYWLCLKPKDAGSKGLFLGVNDQPGRADGGLIPFQVVGDYFKGWRPYDGEALRFEGRSAWKESHEQRLAWEKHIKGLRISD